MRTSAPMIANPETVFTVPASRNAGSQPASTTRSASERNDLIMSRERATARSPYTHEGAGRGRDVDSDGAVRQGRQPVELSPTWSVHQGSHGDSAARERRWALARQFSSFLTGHPT